jgi:hypothetical protein
MNAVTGRVNFSQIQMCGNGTYKDLGPSESGVERGEATFGGVDRASCVNAAAGVVNRELPHFRQTKRLGNTKTSGERRAPRPKCLINAGGSSGHVKPPPKTTCPITRVSSGGRRNTGVKFTRGSLEA